MSTRLIAAALVAIALSACGGGGDNVIYTQAPGTPPAGPEPKPPVDCTKTPELCK